MRFRFRLLRLFVVALYLEGKLNWRSLVGFARMWLATEPVPEHVWRARLRACCRCQVLNRRTWQCRKGSLGCGCSQPVKVLYGGGCWAWDVGMANREHLRIGWPSEHHPLDEERLNRNGFKR